jgi:hypothetical protein
MLELIIWPGGTYHYHPLMLTEAVTKQYFTDREGRWCLKPGNWQSSRETEYVTLCTSL